MRRFSTKRYISSSSSSPSTVSPEFTVKQFVSQGLYEEALQFYKQNVHPFQSKTNTAFIVPSITKACAHSKTHQILGLQIHCNLLKGGFTSEFTVSNSLVSMYAKFCESQSAEKVFDEMPQRDTVSWNAMINCYVQNGFYMEAVGLLKEMYSGGFVPKSELLACCISACVKSENWRLGRAMHGLLFVDEKLEESVFVSTALSDFYCKCYDLDSAFRVFRRMGEKNVVSWTAMISGCMENGDYSRGLACLRAMQDELVEPNIMTLTTVLPACIELGLLRHGKEIHGFAVRRGYVSEATFSSALLHMYCQYEGTLHLARFIFDSSVKKEIVMWSTMIAGYSRNENSADEAIQLFCDMRMSRILPNNITMLAVIAACTNLLALRIGSGIHGHSLKCGFGADLLVQNAFINMYSKCGNLIDSLQVFEEMETRDCVSWSALIRNYGLYGYAEEALRLFSEMQESGIRADEVAYLAVLSACNHAGLVDKGQMLFDQATHDMNVCLTPEHYACYVDLLGRAGKLEAACDVVSRMPVRASPRVWSSLLSACKLHGRLDLAEEVADTLLRVEPENAANYTSVSMIYAESQNWTGVERVRKYMKERNLVKYPSYSKIQLEAR